MNLEQKLARSVGNQLEATISELKTVAQIPRISNQWTSVQVLDHLLQVHAVIVSGIQARSPMPKRFPGLIIRRTIVNFVMNSAIRVPSKGATPRCPVDADFESKAHEIREIQSNLEKLITLDTFENAMIFNHPIAGQLDLIESLKFVLAHLVYHQKRARS
jgi:hypothetical protein